MPRICSICLTMVGLTGWAAAVQGQWTGAPTPHDQAHLRVVRAADFRDAQLQPIAAIPIVGAAAGKAIAIESAATATLHIQHAGKYAVWIRIGGPAKAPAPMRATLNDGKETLLTVTAHDNSGEVGSGGPDGFLAYAKVAQKTAPGADVASTGDVDDSPGGNAKQAAIDLAAEFAEELAADSGEEQKTNWVTAQRLEEPSQTQPFYWWKLGTAKLEPGNYLLQVEPLGKFKPDRAPLVDIAFASTALDLEYPFLPDIDAPKASYVRFRIDESPAKGLSIGSSLRVHYDPWSTESVWLNPNAMSPSKAEPHKQAGFTRWYRLQDIERAPGFGGGEAQLYLRVSGIASGKFEDCAGATQFAVVPHQDYVLREINWAEPDGLSLSMAPDFETYLHQLRTLRDHAREDYDRAQRATGGQVFPLTRDGLYFGNAWGAATGHQHEYMVKTFRHLGFNCVGETEDAVRGRQLYGWTSHAGQYAPGGYLPFDVEKTRKQYDDDFRGVFEPQRELFEGVSVYQVADEPAEISRGEMSSPLWRFSRSGQGDNLVEKWLDASGDSHLHSKSCDYHDCVLEGTIAQLGGWVGFRVAVDDARQPARFAYWSIGRVSVSMEVNLVVGKEGVTPAETAGVTRRTAVVGPKLTPFKIVYEGTQAALYLNGQLVHQHIDLPKRGGFGIVGATKALGALRFRQIKKNEHLSQVSETDFADVDEQPQRDDLDLDDLLGDEAEIPKWAQPKPLERLVREDFVAGGGVEGAHQAFREWAQQQGLTPQTFGHEKWEDVTMLTVANLVSSPEEARLFYWSRRYSGWLTPKMFALASEAIRKHAPNPQMLNFVALSGHSLYFPSETPLDMFQLASDSAAVMPGISDWMSLGSWRWDSHQAVAFSIAPYNAGARRYGQPPLNHPMMHCVYPSELRAMTMLANNTRYISFYNFGPSYAVTEGYWNEAEGCHRAVAVTANRAAQADDILTMAEMRPSRVAMLYAMSNEYWSPTSSFADKRATFLALSHEGYQPELVTEEQVAQGALAHYDALYLLDPIVAEQAQAAIGEWVRKGGLLWACADAAIKNEFNEPLDLLARTGVCQRTWAAADAGQDTAKATSPRFTPVKGSEPFRAHTVAEQGLPTTVKPGPQAKLRGQYEDGRPAWFSHQVGDGMAVYLAHRGGLTYTSKAARLGGYEVKWAGTGRAMIAAPLAEAQIERELTVSEPTVMAAPLSSEAGTVIALYNMRAVPLHKVRLSLKEPAKPHSVATFSGLSLVPLDYSFRDGRVEMELPELATGQMVIVRRRAAPEDGRLVDILTRTREQLKSNDWRALSTGAFMAGTQPQWKLSSEVMPLVSHESWQVRQAAVEALGKLKDKDATTGLLKLLETETDSHVVGDTLVALARLGNPRAAQLWSDGSLGTAQPFVRQQALVAASELARAGKLEAGFDIDPGLADSDLRVRREAIKLLGLTAPRRAAEVAATAYSPGGRDPQEQATWAEAIAANDAAFDAVLEQPKLAGNDLLIGLSSHRADARLAAILAKLPADISDAQASAIVAAAIHQHDQKLARHLFENRAQLHKTVQAYLPLILEHAYDAQLGSVLTDWENYLADSPE
ncbi:MAG: HEAT repeat domain-containing protein [Pirellulales bacterium]